MLIPIIEIKLVKIDGEEKSLIYEIDPAHGRPLSARLEDPKLFHDIYKNF